MTFGGNSNPITLAINSQATIAPDQRGGLNDTVERNAFFHAQKCPPMRDAPSRSRKNEQPVIVYHCDVKIQNSVA